MAQFIWFTKLTEFGSTVVASISQRLKKRKMLASSTIYQNLKSINIYLWAEILETQNITLLDKNYSEDKKYNEVQLQQISDNFTMLYDDFFIRLNNKKAKANLSNSQDKMMLSVKIMVLQECYNSMIFIAKNYAKISKGYEKELKIYETVRKVSKNANFGQFSTLSENIAQIGELIKTNELAFERKYGTETEESKYTFEKQLIDVEQVLGRSINIENCNVLQWIEYINKVQEIIKLKEKENVRNKG
jgi:hypothetical protein